MQPDAADVHPDMLGAPVEVDFETGEVRVLTGDDAQMALELERAVIAATDAEGA